MLLTITIQAKSVRREEDIAGPRPIPVSRSSLKAAALSRDAEPAPILAYSLVV